MPEFIAHGKDDYVERAVRFTQNLSELDRIRQSLRERIVSNMSASPEQLTKSVEAVYREIWRKWCNGVS